MAEVLSNSPFSHEVFSNYELFFENVYDENATFVNDENNNPVLQASPGESTIRIVALLRPTSDPRIISMLGADPQKIPFKGRCLDPMQFPNGLLPGAQAQLEINGVSGIFVLGPVTKSVVLAVQEVLGQQIIGTWSSINHPQGT